MAVRPGKNRKAQRLRAVAHFCTAVGMISEGMSRLEMPEIPWPFIVLCWTSAAVIAAVTIAHLKAGEKSGRLEIPVYLLESLVCTNIAVMAFREHKHLLPYAWLLVALLWINTVVISIVKTRRKKGTETPSGPDHPLRPEIQR
jgi:uncharacterized membrane protein YeiB